jgi:hypothetical protein
MKIEIVTNCSGIKFVAEFDREAFIKDQYDGEDNITNDEIVDLLAMVVESGCSWRVIGEGNEGV